MKYRTLCVITALAACATNSFAQAAVVAPRSPRDTIASLAQTWMDAAQKQNRQLLERLMAPEFTVVHANDDSTGSRAHWLEGTVRHPSNALVFEDMRVVHFGSEMAIVTGILRVEVGAAKSRIGVTDVWQKREGRWQVVTRFATRPQDIQPRSASGK